MTRLASVLLALVFSASVCAAGDQTPSADARQQQQSSIASPAGTAPQAAHTVTAYTLPPDLYQKAHERRRIHFRLDLVNFFYGLFALWLILRLKLSAKFRDWAVHFSSRRFLQACIFAPLFVLALDILTLPIDIYGQMVERRFGISIQGWGSWAGDWALGQMVAVILATVFVWILYAVIRKSPQRWWFHFWLASLPLVVLVTLITPWVIDPLFHKFEPLQKRDPALVSALEQMVQRAGVDIPPERMFWMNAGEKTTALNAYVTGIGQSKRIVVWDTTIAKLNAPQIVFTAGHETGHYVLQHVPKGIAAAGVVFLLLFYVGYRLVGWMLARWGAGWGIHALDDWASLPVLVLLLSILQFASNPLLSGFSRYAEHQADQYGLEVTHSLTPDSGQVAAQTFQAMGEVNLADPDPDPLDVFLFFDHPRIRDRVQFCVTYDPWSQGGAGEFIK
ncbi:MAG: M48 family metallopeptidase [Acidobacteria bacterium]|nr:M48 family metallopeptidase [Acidobacteriota bacterium]